MMQIRALVTLSVAYVGCHAVKMLLKPSSLAQQRVHVITVETRRNSTCFSMPGVPGRHYTNVGANRSWQGWHTKPAVLAEWLREKASRSPDELVIYADGSDFVFGGCSDADLVARYHATVNSSGGARVLAGAEMGLWPATFPLPRRYSALDSRRAAVLGALGLNDSAYGAAALCRPLSELFNMSALSKSTGSWTGCSSPPAYQYLNAGFLMGPVSALLEVVEAIAAEANDQLALAEYMLRHPDKVTLDYSGSIVLSLHQFDVDRVLEKTDGPETPLVSNNVDDHGVLMRNRVTGKTQCFIHSNGLNKRVMAYARRTWPSVDSCFSNHTNP